MITADAGMRGGKTVAYRHLVDEALHLAKHPPAAVVIVDRKLEPATAEGARAHQDYAALVKRHAGANVECEWLESSEPSYILYTSGTTGNPKGIQRDTGGYAVALTASMRDIFCVAPGETMFTTSDIGWVVGHSYIVYAPLLNGSTTVMYEGLPIRPDPGIWWQIVAEYGVRTMFTSPTAIRVLKKQDTAFMKKHDLSSLRYLFLAGEPLDEPTAHWAADALGVPIVDNYWQTESGWPILSAQPGIEDTPRKFGSPSFPACGYDVRLLHEVTGAEVGGEEKGVLAILPPLPPGCMTTVWGDDRRFVETYFSARLFDVRLGDAGCRRLLLRAWPHRRCDQCRGPSSWNEGDRGSRAGTPRHCGSRGGRHRRFREGSGADRLRGSQGSSVDRNRREHCARAQGSDGNGQSSAGGDRASR